MLTPFEVALAFVLEREGGYSNDANDPGGETNFGISKRAYPHLNMKALTREDAVAIYWGDYWIPCRCDSLPDEVAIMVFDCAVNQGVEFAKRTLQQTLGVVVDGDIGPKTQQAAKRASVGVVVGDYASARIRRYLGMNNAAEERFERGWCERVIRCVVCALSFNSGETR